MDAINKMIFYLNYYEKKNSNSSALAHMLSHIREIPEMSIFELADLCYVSAATLSRLVKDMGFPDFTNFKSEIHLALASDENALASPAEMPPLHGEGEELSAALDRYIDWYIGALAVLKGGALAKQLHQAAILLKAANQICLLSSASLWSLLLQRELVLSGKTVITFRRDEDVASFLQRFEAGDLLFHGVRNKSQLGLRREYMTSVRQKAGSIITMTLPELAEALRDGSDVLFTLNGPDRDVSSSLQMKLLLMVYTGLK